jgi:hypothetical protein
MWALDEECSPDCGADEQFKIVSSRGAGVAKQEACGDGRSDNGGCAGPRK